MLRSASFPVWKRTGQSMTKVKALFAAERSACSNWADSSTSSSQLTKSRIDLMDVVEAPPTMLTVALVCDPSFVPGPAFSCTPKYLMPVKVSEFEMGMVIDLSAPSPLAHVRVPVAAVNCAPATAVSSMVLYETDNAPCVPPKRWAVRVIDPAESATL